MDKAGQFYGILKQQMCVPFQKVIEFIDRNDSTLKQCPVNDPTLTLYKPRIVRKAGKRTKEYCNTKNHLCPK